MLTYDPNSSHTNIALIAFLSYLQKIIFQLTSFLSIWVFISSSLSLFLLGNILELLYLKMDFSCYNLLPFRLQFALFIISLLFCFIFFIFLLSILCLFLLCLVSEMAGWHNATLENKQKQLDFFTGFGQNKNSTIKIEERLIPSLLIITVL